jgi:hypothetical protein
MLPSFFKGKRILTVVYKQGKELSNWNQIVEIVNAPTVLL